MNETSMKHNSQRSHKRAVNVDLGSRILYAIVLLILYDITVHKYMGTTSQFDCGVGGGCLHCAIED